MSSFKLKLDVTTKTEEEQLYFDLFRLRTTPDGLELSAKSPLFHNYFRSKASKKTDGAVKVVKVAPPWDFHALDVPQNDRALCRSQGIMDYRFVDFFYDELPNMIWLLHPKLGDGFTLLLPVPMALNDLPDYFLTCSTFIQSFYKKNLRMLEMSGVFKVVEERNGVR